MEQNVGSFDKTLRIVVGLIIIMVGTLYNSWWGAIGLLPIATALLGWCPPYALLGINTGKHKTRES